MAPAAALHDYIAALDPNRSIIIAGSRRASSTTFTVDDPGTEQLLTSVSEGTAEDATAAVDAATAAGREWKATAPRERSAVLHRAFELMIEAEEALTQVIMAENGKPEADARSEVLYAAAFFRWYSEEAVRIDGGYSEAPVGGTRSIVTRRPVGVAALVTPWNFPAAMATRKLGPALAAGCSVVLKPAAETPLTAIALLQLLAEAGLPDGVANLVPTTDAAAVVSTWLDDTRVRKLSFTGSTPVGRLLLRQAANRVVNTSMELGGNAPFIVAKDADVQAAVEGALIAKFRNGGQACTAANRFFVHEAVVDAFTDTLGRAVESLRVGPASDPHVQVGPVISSRAVERIRRVVADAVAAGARITHEAPVDQLSGYFVAPMVLRDVSPTADIVTEEVFGPVVPITTYCSDEELLGMANDSEYGLAAYVYSQDLQRALQLAESLDAGMVGINRGVVSDPAAPFGGVKQSGLGREGAHDGMLEFTETQYFSVDWSSRAGASPSNR